MAQICVIGGGIAGMSVAARLAAKRHEVTILEEAEVLGGQTAAKDSGPLTVDTGPTLLSLPAVYRDLFRKTGKPLEDELELTELEPGYTYHFADASQLTLPGGSIGRTTQVIADEMGPQSAEGWESITGEGGAMWQVLRQVWTHPSLASWDKPTQRSFKASSTRRLSRKTLFLLAKHLFKDPRMIQIVARYAGRYGWDPREAPASLAVHPFIEQTFGLWEIAGGMSAFASTLQRRCESLGVRIQTQTQAARVLTSANQATAVECSDGRRFPAQIVVSAVPARTLYATLIAKGANTKTSRHIRKLPLSHSRFVVRLGLDTQTQAPRHNVWFPSSIVSEYDDIARGLPANQPAIYGHRTTMGDRYAEQWQFVVNAPNPTTHPQPYDWSPTNSARYAEYLLKTLAHRGLDLRSRTQNIHTRSPTDFHKSGQSFGFAPRGLKSSLQQPENITGVAGVYAVGNEAHPGYGLAQAGLSAELVADLIGKA